MSDRRRTPQRVPVPTRVVNCASVSTGPRRAARIFRVALTTPGRFGVPWVVLGCEAADFDAVLEAEKLGWDAAQFKESSATAGSVVAWDPERALPLGGARLIPGSPAGEGIQARSFVQQRLHVGGHARRFNAGHNPPDRAERGQETFLESLRRVRGVIGLDSNERPAEIAAMGFRREYVGHELLGLFVPRGISTSLPRRVDLIPEAGFDDHPAVDVLLWQDLDDRRTIPLPG